MQTTRDHLSQQEDVMTRSESDLNDLLDNGLIADDDVLVSQVSYAKYSYTINAFYESPAKLKL